MKNKIAIITGASKGIGKAIAYQLGLQGAKVVVSSRNQESLDLVVAEFKHQNIEAAGIAAKIGDAESMQSLTKQTIDLYGGVDILVNNAAVNPVFGPVVNTDTIAFEKIMKVNLQGPFELAKLLYPTMVERGGGSIINISSIGGISPEKMLGIYSVSKAALISLTKVLAKEWGEKNIRVNVICPGLIKTKFSQALWQNDQILHSFLKEQPLPRMGTPEEVAALAQFLAADASGYCTGGVFTVDGGYTI